jgi:imidazolonepropionase-like amidohydrolase
MSISLLGLIVISQVPKASSTPATTLKPKVMAAEAPAIQETFPYETNAKRKPKLKTNGSVFIKNARILTATHGVIEKGNILVKDGKIVAIGNVLAPAGVTVIDATGKVVSPGIVDAHVHRGIDSTNEGTDAIVAEVRVQDVLNPDSKTLWASLASGETSGLVLHGSANPIGGQSLVVKFKYGHPVDELPIADAPRMIKFALGENVTRSGTSTSARFPHTRMGVEAVYRRAFTQAREYGKKWDAYELALKTDPKAKAPQRDLRLETLSDILKRKIWVQCHSYRADEILMMVRLSQEFGFKIGAMQHALESYKIAPELAKAGVGVSIFVDEWAVKLELFDSIPYAASILSKAGVNVSVNTDGVSGTTAINIDAAKTMRHGGLTPEQALDLITINPARELGIDHRTGSIDIGKDADLVIWDGDPLSVYSRVNTTLIDGEVYFQRRDAFNVDNDATIKSKLEPFKYIASEPLPPQAKAYAIIGGTVHTASGPVLSNATVVLVDGKVKAVGTKVDIPANAVKIDAKGMQVYPGFIDSGTSLGLNEFGEVGQATDERELGTYEPDLVALTAVNAQSEHFPTTRMEGITSALTVPAGGTIPGQASVLNLAGWTTELMGLKPKAGLVINWPLSSGGGADFGLNQIKDDDDITDEMLAGGQSAGPRTRDTTTPSEIATYFDKAVTYKTLHESVDLGLEAMQPYIKGELPILIRARDRAGIRSIVDFAKKYKVKVVIVGDADVWKEAKLLAKNHVPVIINPAGKSTLSANFTTNDWDPYDTPYATPILLKRAGVQFSFQSDDYAGVKNLPQKVAESCAYGLSKEDALKSITLWAAQILGVDDKVGSIAPGKLGNIVISDGDAFELNSNIRYVFIDGKPIELKSKFTRLRDQYLQRVQ